MIYSLYPLLKVVSGISLHPKTVKNSLEKISAELSPKMPTSLKDVNIVLLNPLNSNLDLYIASEGEVTYDYIKENDD